MEPQQYYVKVDKKGTVRWYRDLTHEILHRVGGPAVEYADGTKFYYEDNKMHASVRPQSSIQTVCGSIAPMG